jgi:hypothetical protein
MMGFWELVSISLAVEALIVAIATCLFMRYHR